MAIAAGAEIQVNTHTAGDQSVPHLTALADGGWVVVWHSSGQDGELDGLTSVYQQAYNSDGSARGGETRVNTYTAGNQWRPQTLALDNGGWVVVWESIGQDGSSEGLYQQAFDADGIAIGLETQVNTFTTGNQSSHQVTALGDDGGWVVVWESNGQDGSADGVYQQAYNADGTELGVETRVNTHTPGTQTTPQITVLVDGGWVVTWFSSGQDGTVGSIYQQAYNEDGTQRGTETLVHAPSPPDYHQNRPQIAALTTGGWVVTWTSQGQDSAGFDAGVFQRAFNADGSELLAETQVNTFVNDDQSVQIVTALAGGGWVVAWESEGQDGEVGGIASVYQQAYNADGTPLGGETRVNTQIVGEQGSAEFVALPDGGWVVIWEEPFSPSDIYLQAFNPDGTAHDGEVRVNVETAGLQRFAEATSLGDGNWIVTWQDDQNDGEDDGVFQRAFWVNDAPVLADPIDILPINEDIGPFSVTFSAGTSPMRMCSIR